MKTSLLWSEGGSPEEKGDLIWRNAVELWKQSYAILLLDEDALQRLLVLLHLHPSQEELRSEASGQAQVFLLPWKRTCRCD